MGVADIARVLQRRFDEYVGALREMVDIDSGSFSPDGVNRMADICESRFEGLGWQVERIRPEPTEHGQLGDLVIGRSPGNDGPHVLIIGHTDTVFDDGTAAERPFSIEGESARGPGVSDMKSGLLLGFFALEALKELGLPIGSVTYFCNPDEEIGSPFSGPRIKELAGSSDVALVLESGRVDGSVVSQRKGVIDFTINIEGVAAHAGVEPELGRSALVEAAHLTLALTELNGRWPGVTVNVGTLSAGTRSNVVAERAHLVVDVRSPEGDTLDAAYAEIERICASPVTPGVLIEAAGRRWHRPMEKSEASQRLVDMARQIASEIGWDLVDSATGGASDACTTSAAGVPTLDGLGPVGGGDHGPLERIDLTSAVPRATLLAGIVARVSESGGV